MAKPTSFCFRCNARAVRTVHSRPGSHDFPWQRRVKRCDACGSHWRTIEILDPRDPIALELRGETPEPVDWPVLSPPELAPLGWQEVVTWR